MVVTVFIVTYIAIYHICKWTQEAHVEAFNDRVANYHIYHLNCHKDCYRIDRTILYQGSVQEDHISWTQIHDYIAILY